MSTAVMANIFTETVQPLVRAAKEKGATVEALSAAFLSAVDNIYGQAEARQTTAQVGFAHLLASEGGSVSAKAAAALYGGKTPSSDEAVRKAARLGQVIAIRDGRGGLHFPCWQFSAKGGVLPGLREIIGALRQQPHFEDLKLVTFMLNPSARLGGRRPLDVLRERDEAGLKRVLELAAAQAE